MKNEHNKNEALRGPLMFTIPACGFVVAPKLDWLYKINRVADHTKKLTVTHARDLDLALIDPSNLVATRRIFNSSGRLKNIAGPAEFLKSIAITRTRERNDARRV